MGPLGKNLNSFSIGIAEVLGFSELSIYTEVALHNTFNYASNIVEVSKFYNPGNKTFETDFSFNLNSRSESTSSHFV